MGPPQQPRPVITEPDSISQDVYAAFVDCVQCLGLVNVDPRMPRRPFDPIGPRLQLAVCEIRLLRWGAAAGMRETHPAIRKAVLSFYGIYVLQQARQALERISTLFRHAKGESQPEHTSNASDGVQAPEHDHNEAVQALSRRRTALKMKYWSSNYEIRPERQQVNEEAGWTPSSELRLIALLRQVKRWIDELDRLFPDLLRWQRNRALEDADELGDVENVTLAAVAAYFDGLLAEAVEIKRRSPATRVDNVKSKPSDYDQDFIDRVGTRPKTYRTTSASWPGSWSVNEDELFHVKGRRSPSGTARSSLLELREPYGKPLGEKVLDKERSYDPDTLPLLAASGPRRLKTLQRRRDWVSLSSVSPLGHRSLASPPDVLKGLEKTKSEEMKPAFEAPSKPRVRLYSRSGSRSQGRESLDSAGSTSSDSIVRRIVEVLFCTAELMPLLAAAIHDQSIGLSLLGSRLHSPLSLLLKWQLGNSPAASPQMRAVLRSDALAERVMKEVARQCLQRDAPAEEHSDQMPEQDAVDPHKSDSETRLQHHNIKDDVARRPPQLEAEGFGDDFETTLHAFRTSPAYLRFKGHLLRAVHEPYEDRIEHTLRGVYREFESLFTRLKHMSDLSWVPAHMFTFSTRESIGILDSVKGMIEDYMGETWDWWPLNPRKRPLKPGDVRVNWSTVSALLRYHRAVIRH